MASAVNLDNVYSAAMKEIKERIVVAGSLSSRMIAPPHVIHECMALQIRMATELLAVACVAAHDALGPARRLHTEWNATNILSRLEAAHPDFFPIPFEASQLGGVTNLKLINPNPGGKYLTRPDLLDMYGKAGNLLHVGMLKTIVKQKPRKPSLAEMESWFVRLHTLLADHLIVRNDLHLICSLGPLASPAVSVVTISDRKPGS